MRLQLLVLIGTLPQQSQKVVRAEAGAAKTRRDRKQDYNTAHLVVHFAEDNRAVREEYVPARFVMRLLAIVGQEITRARR